MIFRPFRPKPPGDTGSIARDLTRVKAVLKQSGQLFACF